MVQKSSIIVSASQRCDGSSIYPAEGRMTYHIQINYTEKLLLDYRFMDDRNITPRYAFGFGLSYTTFEYSALSITQSGAGYAVTFRVANTGVFAGAEKPQLYLEYPIAAGEPKKVLRGLEEIILTVGESSEVTMFLGEREMRCVFFDSSRTSNSCIE